MDYMKVQPCFRNHTIIAQRRTSEPISKGGFLHDQIWPVPYTLLLLRPLKRVHSFRLMSFIPCFLLVLSGLYAQNYEIDSLKTALEKHTPNDSTKADLLYYLAFAHFQSDLKTTEQYLTEAERLSQKINF